MTGSLARPHIFPYPTPLQYKAWDLWQWDEEKQLDKNGELNALDDLDLLRVEIKNRSSQETGICKYSFAV